MGKLTWAIPIIILFLVSAVIIKSDGNVFGSITKEWYLVALNFSQYC